MSNIFLFGVNGEPLDLTNGRERGGLKFPYGFRMAESPSFWGGPRADTPEYPAFVGSRRGNARHIARRIGFDLLVEADSPADLLAAQRYWAKATDQTRNDCRFVVEDREIAVTLETDSLRPTKCDSVKMRIPTVWKAHWPYWRGRTDIPVSVPIGVGGSRPTGGWSYNEALSYNYPAPYTGLFTSDAGDLELLINNPGDVDVYPRWNITGRAIGFTVSNRTTSKSFTVDSPLDPGDVLQIDSRREAAHPLILNHTFKRRDWLQRGGTLFALAPGINRIVADVDGALASESSIECVFRPEYLTV